ncbi:MAG: metal-dependent hydrolase [Candidatus Hodarchaeota archaeon]
MKGLTHVFFGMGLVSILLGIFKIHPLMWGFGILIISPIFSRLPDQDQKISRLTFNQIVPHRGKTTHNLLFCLPLLFLFAFFSWGFLGQLLIMLIGSIFGALFAHAFVDAFNYGGVWIGFFHLKIGSLKWDSFLGNLTFRLLGVLMVILSIFLIF